MDRLSLIDQFSDLRDISDNVTDYLDRELYQDSFEAGSYNSNDILRECYTIILQELRELGIFFFSDIDDLLADWYTAKYTYFLRVLADARTIVKLCEDSNTMSKFDSFTQEEDCSDLLANMTEYLYYKYPTELQYKYIVEFSDRFYCTDRFRDHLQTILKKLAQQDPAADIPNLEAASSYIKRVLCLRTLAKQATDIIINELQLEGKCNLQLIRKILNDYDMDKISSDDLRIFSLIDNPDFTELTPQLLKLKEVMLQKHHERAVHHIEYWLKHTEIHPAKENLIVLVAHHFEPESTPDDFRKEIDEMINKGLKIFTPEDIQFIQDAAQCILNKAFKTIRMTYPSSEDGED